MFKVIIFILLGQCPFSILIYCVNRFPDLLIDDTWVALDDILDLQAL